MTSLSRDRLKLVSIADLTPTQFTVGMREVDFKRTRWREKHSFKAKSYLTSHSIPLILGPCAGQYIIDRHHLVRALYEEGVTELHASVVEDLSALSVDEFWYSLESRGRVHPFDDEGKRRAYEEMPRSVLDLTDDPFRSLAGALKREGGYNKSKAPFSEFQWTDFLRNHIAREIVAYDFDRALSLAFDLARNQKAQALPGWLGPASSANPVHRIQDRIRTAHCCA